jgi:hypothetical protein
MRTRVEVKDLNLRQWDHITTHVPVDGRVILEGVPRVCAVFELAPEISEIHVEMDVVEFAALVVRLETIRNEPSVTEVARAALTPDRTCPDGIEGCLADHSVTKRPV